MRRSTGGVGIAGIVLLIPMMLINSSVAFCNVGGAFPRELLAASLLGVFWFCVVLLSFFLVVAYVRTRLRIADEQVCLVGAFSSRTIRYDQVSEARWRDWPAGGSLVIRDGRQRIAVGFADFSPSDQADLISGFRQRLPLAVQQNWEAFQTRSTRTLKPLDYRWGVATYFFSALFIAGLGAKILKASLEGIVDNRIYMILPLTAVCFAMALGGVWRMVYLWRNGPRAI